MTGIPSSRRGLRTARFSVEASIVLLFGQILLGMWVNLFAKFPSPTIGVNPLDQLFTGGPVLLVLHVLLGLTLGILSIAGLAAALAIKDKRLAALEVAALLSVLLAGESGIEFVLGWYQEDLYSYAMTVGFVLLTAVYIWTSRKMREWYPLTN